MRTSSQLFPENKIVTVDDLVTARSEAKNDMGDINALLSAIELSLVEKLKDHNLSKFAFDKTFCLIDIAKTHVDLSQDYHNGELAQLTGGGKYQCTAVKASKSLDTKPDGKPAKELKDRLKLSRKNAGITQEVLALSSGTNQSTISQLESGLMRSSTHIPAIAKVLGVDAHWLQTGREDSASVKINQLCLAPANAAISKTLTEGFKNDGRR